MASCRCRVAGLDRWLPSCLPWREQVPTMALGNLKLKAVPQSALLIAEMTLVRKAHLANGTHTSKLSRGNPRLPLPAHYFFGWAFIGSS